MTSPASTALPDRDRLDQILVRLGLYESRSRARDAIARGAVDVDGRAVTKPGALVSVYAAIRLSDPARDYVSRAALKLKAGLTAFGFDPAGRVGLDIGASTGGFTQVLLERGASHVIAVDVGHDQLHASLATDPRVSNLEGLNARDLTRDHLEGREIGAVVSDVSFISLRLALPPALELAAPGAVAVLLVKPQFEAGRAAIGKGGLLKDPAQGPIIAEDLAAWLGQQPGWSAVGPMPSPIEGQDGNHEFLIGGVKA
ncbi:MAG: TlyA family RNA methyltransferase [Hoeflea sp.]|uniref:TlyA family RNA methyltransferase n=1 Tax=Hoeflea sp. TaxID=1940281 RepID=UPI001D8ABA4C|nr:TlyA family RNA methyltransferase [Hoeflea sp.]MBU4527710.1 TlyA family RNA methyltransferase [Alphaproteobacteria bacterium]MBU4546255.1 TlyA family RNA methyltransferase [Alphaproteobacteria bacterium]MBU4553060.1 TlyA family RNA methyltransferase [Alphaproteobacteria bacterium]MBV1724132.1 TlyA family RNA methyltransferase [Hoeflea sp.]MBV1759817.1 TlyA family RNA methyltransferase [Hoeflea sp.]